MKSFTVNLEDRLQPGVVNSRSINRGRPKNGVSRKKAGEIGLKELGNKFYIKVVNLSENDIPDFIRDYQVTLPCKIDGTNYPIPKDILDFQEDLKNITKNIKVFKKIRNNRANTHKTINRVTNELPSLINKYLSDCHLQVDFPPIIEEPLSKEGLSSYKEQILSDKTELGFLINDVLKISEKRRGKNFSNLVCRCDSILSWCVLDLVIDLLNKKELIRVCHNCDRIFRAENAKIKYCQDKKCKKDVQNKRQKKSRG